MKCIVCGAPVEGKRLCPECDKEVKRKLEEMEKQYPGRFNLGKVRG